jgi:hypothetical protein
MAQFETSVFLTDPDWKLFCPSSFTLRVLLKPLPLTGGLGTPLNIDVVKLRGGDFFLVTSFTGGDFE